jgi:hypothetical protein
LWLPKAQARYKRLGCLCLPNNGIASYELALHYRRTGKALLAAQFESRAQERGYTPPPSLDHFRK